MSDIKISQLPVANVVNDNDIVVINQGSDTKTAAKSLIIAGLATTDQVSGFATTAQVESITSAQIAAITPASIGALSTADASAFATTEQLSGYATTTDIQGIAFTSQLSAFATTSQISGLTNSAQVQAIASAQIAAITPASIGAVATSAIIAIAHGGTGATDAPSALAALGGITSAQVPAFDSAQLSAYVQKAGATMEGRLIMAATTAQAKANIGGALTGVAAPASSIAGDVWVSNQSKLTFSPSTGTAVTLAGLSQQNTFNQQQTIGSATAATGLIVSNTSTGRAATFAAASTAAAVAITQTGTGEAFRVEDEASPDATPFVISASGRVGIGVTPDAVTALAVDSGGIKFNDGSIQTTAVGSFSTAQLSGYATTTQIQGIAFTSQLSGFATTDQISGFTTSAQVQVIASAQISTITPASIGALSTSDVVQISQGGTGEVTSTAALVALGGMPLNQAAGGDLSGAYPDPTVAKLQGYNVSTSAPFGGAILQWIGTEWTPATSPSGSVTSVETGAGLTGGPITSDGVIALETTGVAALTYGSATQVAVLDVNQFGQITSASNEAITPAGIGALSTDAASGFATTAQIQGIAFTSQLSAFATTDQLSGYATTTDIQGIAFTSQLAAFTNSAQVQALASAQIAAITPGSIGAVATSDVIAISKGGTGSTSAAAALTALGAMSATQAAGGDLSGSLPNPTVAKIQGISVTNVTPLDGQVLQYDTTTSTWVAGAIPNGGSGGGGQTFFFNYDTAADAPTTGLPTTPTIVKELGRVSDTTGTSYTSGSLSQTAYDLVVHFVTDVLDPNITAIPAGLFDFNFWASSNANAANQTIVQLKVFKYDGTTATLLATSDDISIYDPTVAAQYIASVVLPQTTVALNDRLYIQFLGKGTTNNRTVTFNFGATQPSHVHTTIPSVGGTGLVKVINGVFQSPASKLVDSDVATNAAISLSKIAMSEVSVLTVDGLTGGGDLSTSRTLSLTTTGVSALSYGSSTQVSAFTVDAYGRLSAASNVAISASGIGAQPALTSAAPASIVQGGTGATTAVAALSNLGGISSSALAGYATTGQLSGFATTGQLAGLQPALTSAAPAAIEQGGTGATDAVSALANLGGITTAALSGYASTSQLAGLQPALTTAAPLGIDKGGTGATTAIAALANLGSLHFAGGWSQTSVVTGTMDTGVTPNTFTITATGALTVDGGSPLAGEVVIFTAQPTASQSFGRDNGPWVVVNPGGVGIQATFVRPDWFSGTVKTGILVTNQYGTSRTGTTHVLQGPVTTTSGDFINVGADIITVFVVYQRVSNATTGSNSFSARQSFAVNSATVNPISFSPNAATLLTTRVLGAVEWDNQQLYITSSTQFAALNRNPIATATVLINAQTGTSYTPVLADAGKLITASNAAAISLTIPTDATVDFPVGTQLIVMQLGFGQVTASAVTPGTTAVNSKNGTKTSGQYAVISLIKVAANSWVVGGDATT